MKSRRGFIAMVAGALPAAAVARVALGNQNRVPDEKQPKTVVPETREEWADALKSIIQGEGYIAPVEGVRWLPADNKFPLDAQVHDCFYHDGRDAVYVLLDTGWIRMGHNGQMLNHNGPYVSNSRKIEWVIEDGRIVMTKMPWEYARKYLKGKLTGLKWHGFDARYQRRVWSCDLNHLNTTYLRDDCGTTTQDRSLG